MSYTDKALQAHMKSTLHTGFTPYNGKIADITHADTNKHEITLAALGLPDNAKVLILGFTRISGTGSLQFYPNEGAQLVKTAGTSAHFSTCVAIINERLQYDLQVANDDFDLYCFGYWTSGQVIG